MHKGGNRGKRALDALKKGGARVIDAPSIKSDRDKASFVTNEFRSARRKVSPDAVQALLDAVGKDLGELAAACAQLVADTTGVVDVEQVDEYYGGKVEATGFRVAEMAVAGNAGRRCGCCGTRSRRASTRCRSWRCSPASCGRSRRSPRQGRARRGCRP